MGAIAPSKMPGAKQKARRDNTDFMEDGEMRQRRDNTDFTQYAEGGKVSPAWQRKEGKNPEGGLNAKGRASYNKANPGKPGLKAPQPQGGPRKDSFCARMEGMKAKLTGEEAKRDPDSRINKSLRAWKC